MPSFKAVTLILGMFEAVAGPSMGEQFGDRETVIVLSWVLLTPSL